MINDLVISQIRQRLEILYQMVDELETGGGGGGTSDYSELSNKPQINSTTLEGNKTAAQLGLATSAALSSLSATVADLFASDPLTISDGGTLTTDYATRVANHMPIYFNNDEYSGQYYFIEDEGSVFTIYATLPTSGSLPTITYARIERSTNKVEFYQTAVDTTPINNSENLITSGGVYTALQDKADVEPVADLINNGAKNILKNTATSRTLSGVTFTVNADESVTVTGTATGSTGLRVAGVQGSNAYADAIPIPKGRYTIYPSNSGSSTIRWGIGIMTASNATRNVTYIFDNPVTIDVTNDTTRYDFTLAVSNGTVCNGETLYPMICTEEYYEISPEYVPYAPSNRDLYKEVDAKASIADIYGVKPVIPNGTDLDTMQTPGAYACGGAGTAATLINCPTATEAFIMYVDHIAATTRIIQRLYAMNTGTGVPCVYIRALYSGGWGAWYKFEGTVVS